MTSKVEASVAIIIPCYNGEKFISETLKSVQQQAESDWRCIVVDDGSTDSSKDIIFQTIGSDDRFQYHYQPNRGLAAARNFGISLTDSPYIQLLDADDMIEPHKILDQLNCLKGNSQIDILAGPTQFIDSEGRLISEKSSNRVPQLTLADQQNVALGCFVRSNPFPVNAYLFKRSLWVMVSGFDGSLKYYEDWDFWLRCVIGGAKVSYLNSKSPCVVRCHSDSMIQNRLGMLRALCQVRSKLFKTNIPTHARFLNACLLVKDRLRHLKASYSIHKEIV